MVFAATQRGVVQFNHNFKPMPVCVELLVTAINIDDAPFNLDSKIQLKPNIKSLDIQFTDLCYAAKGTSQYYYRLTKNEPWILTRDPIISLRSLKPGQYSLDIITSQGLEFGLDPLSIPVAVMPYWWQQIWVWILGFLILALVAYLLYLQQARSAKMNEDLLRYQLTSLNAQMNPHFIFNFLNSIQSFIYKNERTQATAYLSEFAELMRKMLDQTKVEQITLQEEISTVSLMASLEQKRFENPFEFEVIVSPEIAPLDLKIPSMLIQPHLENAIWHGIRHIKTKGSIVILIECGKENEIVISIKDNGVGIKASKPVEHKSSGLELTRSRHELICKKNGVKPRFEISDNPTGNDCPGTQVQFNLPTN